MQMPSRFFLIIFSVPIILCSCREQIEEAADCTQDTIIYDRYINDGLGLSLRIPLQWDTISDAERKEWENTGKAVLDSSRPIIPVHNLIGLQHNKDNMSSTFRISCIAQAEFPQLKSVRDYTKYTQQIMDRGFARIGVASHSSIEERNIGGKTFDVLRMYFYTRFSTTYRIELMSLYHKGNIVTLSLGYDNELDSIELSRTINTLEVGD